MERNVVILDIDYVTYDDKPVIRLFSKDGDKNIVLIDDTFEPYLYVVSDNIDACIDEINENLDVISIEKVIKKDFQIEREFLKVTFRHPQDLAKSRDDLRDLVKSGMEQQRLLVNNARTVTAEDAEQIYSQVL